jgi:hypothetical protein
MPVQAGSRWSHRPRLISAAAARKTSRTRYSRPRQRRSDQGPARCPIDCSTRARRPAGRGCGAFSVGQPILGPPVPDLGMPVLAGRGQPAKAPINQGDGPRDVKHLSDPRQRQQFVLVAATGPAAVTPQQIAVDRGHHHALGGVGVALGVIQHLLVGPGPGPLHPGGKPVDAHRLTGGGHLHQPIAQISQAGDERAIGLAHPERGQFAQQQCDAVLRKLIWSESRPEASVRRAIRGVRGRGYFLARSDRQL